jgi:hypothetical protein
MAFWICSTHGGNYFSRRKAPGVLVRGFEYPLHRGTSQAGSCSCKIPIKEEKKNATRPVKYSEISMQLQLCSAQNVRATTSNMKASAVQKARAATSNLKASAVQNARATTPNMKASAVQNARAATNEGERGTERAPRARHGP